MKERRVGGLDEQAVERLEHAEQLQDHLEREHNHKPTSNAKQVQGPLLLWKGFGY